MIGLQFFKDIKLTIEVLVTISDDNNTKFNNNNAEVSLTKTCESIFNINKEYMAIILMTVGSIMTTTAYVYAN